MRRLIPALALVGTIALAVAVASPASADTTGDTVVTLTLNGGELAITVPGPATGDADTALDVSVVGEVQLGVVTVTDLRGGTANWDVSAGYTEFAGPSEVGPVTYVVAAAPGTVGEVTATRVNEAGVPLTAGSGDPLTNQVQVINATYVSGSNEVTWNPEIDITLPAGALAGDYTSTITHSVL